MAGRPNKYNDIVKPRLPEVREWLESGATEKEVCLKAMGIPYSAAHGTIRFSLSKYNTDADIDAVIAALPPIIARLREISPYWNRR